MFEVGYYSLERGRLCTPQKKKMKKKKKRYRFMSSQWCWHGSKLLKLLPLDFLYLSLSRLHQDKISFCVARAYRDITYVYGIC